VQFVKRHSFVLICGAAVVVAFGLAGFGWTRGSAVLEELEQGRGLARNIDRLLAKSNPATLRAIDQINRQIEQLRQVEDAFLTEAARVNQREPLVEGLFPEPEDEGPSYAFMDAYKAEFDRFLTELQAAKAISREELRNWKTMISEEKEAFRSGETPLGFSNIDPLLLAQLPEAVRWNYAARAAIWEARHSRCYAELGSFDVRRSVYQPKGGEPPDLDRLWSAQTSLWIQQDIVGALIDLNNARAEALANSPGDQETPWVEDMPVKQIVGIRVTDYLYEQDTPPPAPEAKRLQSIYQKRRYKVAVDVGDPPQDVLAVLTERGGGDQFDVMHTRVVLVVDPRDLPGILDEILKRNLFTLLNVRYRYVPVSRNYVGLLYGSGPVIQVEIDLAVHWLTDIYVRDGLMPEVTRKRLGFE
jgi:hypothetical protein